MGPLQTVYKEISTKLRARYSQKCLIDIVSEDEQRKIIFDEHKKAHRNYDENKYHELIIGLKWGPLLNSKFKNAILVKSQNIRVILINQNFRKFRSLNTLHKFSK